MMLLARLLCGAAADLSPAASRGMVRCMGMVLMLTAPLCAGTAQAQQYPSKPIRIIVPFAPGGPNDILGRLMGQKLTEQFGHPSLIENRGGAGGTVGLDAAAKAAGDGYTLAMGGSSNMTVAPSLYRNLPYDPLRDFTPVINVAHVPYALGVNPTVPARSVKDLVAIAARKADYLSYASSGTGSMSNLSAELLKALAGVKILHVPYKGTAPALTDVVAGHVDMMLADLSLIRNHAKAGKLRMIGVTGARRSKAAPDVATFLESGVKGYVIEPWFGVVGPTGIPASIVARLNGVLDAALKSQDVLKRLDSLGYEPIGGSADQLAATIRADIPKYAKIVKAAGIKTDL